MYLICKVVAVILILYLELICLNSIPLIERHKSSSVSVSVSGLMAFNEFNNPNINQNITHYKSTRTATEAATTTTTGATQSNSIENAFQTNPIDELEITSMTESIIEQPNNVNKQQIPDTDNTFIDSNEKIINDVHNGLTDGKNKYKKDENNSNSSSTTLAKRSIENEDNIDDYYYDETDDKADKIYDETVLSLGKILNKTFDESDIERFLFDYDSDKNNVCFLDIAKGSLMWWAHENGTLKKEALFLNLTSVFNTVIAVPQQLQLNKNTKTFELNKNNMDIFVASMQKEHSTENVNEYIQIVLTSNQTLKHKKYHEYYLSLREGYLDLSFRNISCDDHLYKRARTYLFFNDYNKVIAFSAAENNLTHAPYRTLLLFSSNLKYLTLKGNQFAAYKTSKTKDGKKRHLHTDDDADATFRNGTDNPNSFSENIDMNGNTTGERRFHRYGKFGFTNFRRKKIMGTREDGIAWATFPVMPQLTDLDISNCQIKFVTRDAFRNLTNLKRLYISHNKILTIPENTFAHTPGLQYLDLSFTNVLENNYNFSVPTLDAIYNLIYGVAIQPMTFRYLPELIYLDLSHTKMTRNSAVAFTHLCDKVRYISLCYTYLPLLGNALFKNTSLVGLDLSGNPYAAYNVMEDAFEGIASTLRYLYFERSNIKELTWLKYLSNLRVLGLSGNNIKYLSLETLGPLINLRLLDLSSNHIGNWYTRVFTQNENLRVLSLRDNNINILTSEMLRDFQLLDYLSLGDNNFVCDCMLRDFVDIAVANNHDADCFNDVLHQAQEIFAENVDLVGSFVTNGYRLMRQSINFITNDDNATISNDIFKVMMQRYVGQLKRSYQNIKKLYQNPKKYGVFHVYPTLNGISLASSHCNDPDHVILNDKLNRSALKFQLLDYEDEHYWCFNETVRLNFVQLNCYQRNLNDDITNQLDTLTNYVIGTVVSVIGVLLIGVLVYFKRWHIHYYFSYLKSAALVSVAAKDAVDQLNSLAESDPHLVYDVFISYCQSDRQWVLEELLPNVEDSGDISICMHERDFQVGLTILDNIVSCMDRSRALMLIISSNFLLSHWCQFEMHLAQHRIFEVRKEHLILVFLEDIPRNKRPKILQYLMDVKTYIKWPNTGRNGSGRKPTTDERKFFWKRLKRSLENIGLNPHPTTRESHA